MLVNKYKKVHAQSLCDKSMIGGQKRQYLFGQKLQIVKNFYTFLSIFFYTLPKTV